MQFRVAGLVFSGVVLACGCSSDTTTGGNTAGTSAQPSSGNGAGGSAAGQVGASGAAGTIQGGASGSGSGAGGTAVSGSSSGGSAGSSSMAGASGSGGSAGSGGTGTGVMAGCANDPHPLCLDFESPIDKATWTNGADSGVSTMDKAHGEHSYHAYKGAGVLTTTKFGTIKNVLWGRFYLRMTPGAPGGHGNIVGAYEGGDWYELGWQFNGLMGVWHYAGGENPLRSHPDIVDKWYCVELMFDGTKTDMPSWWVDGQPVETYMGEPNNKKPHTINQFDKLTIGFTSYAGLGLNKEPYGNNDPPVMTDMWLDDIAFDVKRIGCIAP